VFVRALLATISAAGMERRVTIQSFDWRTLQIVQKEAPSIPTVYLTAARTSPRNIEPAPNSSPWTSGFDPGHFGESIPRAVKAAGGAVWSPYYAELTRETLEEAHALGLKVVPWTVNTETDMRRLIEWGVDGIISDYPDLLVTVARARAR
jgi:glycerophosphoryl diester phosphodiesterase